ncbi:hypothetical protein MASR2M78_26880 [Treponema sp.]
MAKRNLKETIDAAYRVIRQVHREKATGVLEFELKELQNLFSLLVLGSLVGLPSPPPAIAVELLPLMEDEIRTMTSRSDFAQDPLGALMGMLSID